MGNINFPQEEEKILKFWEEKDIFKKTLEINNKNKNFSFYDGPPFATGKPHYGHILASSLKDTICRFFSQRKRYIERKLGWDCHGLPVESLIEKELGIKTKKDIEKLGIEKFNLECKKAVTRHVADFKETLKRLGRFADYKKDYFTMDKTYTETVWWVLKEIYKKGLLYEDFRVVAYCPRCGTPLSNFEVNQGYKDVEDISIYILFKLKNEPATYFLVWTTTPWTLPANLELAIGDFEYVKIKVKDKFLILAKERLSVVKEKFEIVKRLSKEDLIGLEYEPLFKEGLKYKIGQGDNSKAFRVYEAPFVSVEEGTGIVHIAPSFGEDDMELGKETCNFMLLTVDEEGKNLVAPGKGKWVKDADKDIIEDLKRRGLLYREEKIVHTYPFCWRCDTPLLYYPVKTFYIKVSAIKDILVENNKKIHWVPHYLKEGRFGKWLKDAKDWAISRNRYWGAPLPIWKCDKCGEIEVIGSIKELKGRGGSVPEDLHRPYIDEVIFKCKKCKGKMKRTEEVFDCWFESGSMPYAQFHYPFENKEKTKVSFPADFIAEGLDQTRGWFYTLHVIASILTLNDIGLGKNKPAFKNVVVNGIILDEEGKKLSKKLKNYPDPREIFNKYGADALRFFLISSSPLGENYRFSERLLKLCFQNVILRYLNSYLFLDYISKTFKIKKIPKITQKDILDCWIIERLKDCNSKVIKLMEDYELVRAAREIEKFLADLSLWYIRRVKTKIYNKSSASRRLAVLKFILKIFSILSAPFLPYASEFIYQRLKDVKDRESVHLCFIEKLGKADKNVLLRMERIREIVSQLLDLRKKHQIKVRQPLREAKAPFSLNEEEKEIIKEEINVKEINKGPYSLDTLITPNLKKEGMLREFIRQIQDARKRCGYKYGERALFYIKTDKYIEKFIKDNASEINKKTSSEFEFKKNGEEVKRFYLDNKEVIVFK